jgi:hypothetical protein
MKNPLGFVALGLLLLAACSEMEAKEARARAAVAFTEALERTEQALAGLEEETRDEREALCRKLEQSVERLRVEAEELGRLAAERGGQAREQAERTVERIDAELAEAGRKLRELAEQGDEHWQRLQEEARQALERAREMYEGALRRV